MYNQLAQTATSEIKQTLATDIKANFQELNDRQYKAITAIEDKLHTILNKRVPQDTSSKPETNISDFSTEIGTYFQSMRFNTNRLDDILTHLNGII